MMDTDKLAERIAADCINKIQSQVGPLAINAHALVESISTAIAPLLAENERLRVEIERLRNAKCVHDLAEEFARSSRHPFDADQEPDHE